MECILCYLIIIIQFFVHAKHVKKYLFLHLMLNWMQCKYSFKITQKYDMTFVLYSIWHTCTLTTEDFVAFKSECMGYCLFFFKFITG